MCAGALAVNPGLFSWRSALAMILFLLRDFLREFLALGGDVDVALVDHRNIEFRRGVLC